MKDYKEVTKLALLLWPDNELQCFEEEFKSMLVSKEALILSSSNSASICIVICLVKNV